MRKRQERPDAIRALDVRIERARRAMAESTVEQPDIARIRSRATRQRTRSGVVSVLVVALSALAAAVVWGGDSGSSEVVAGPAGVGQPGATNATLLQPGEVRSIAPAPLSGRSTVASVWTGTEMVVWGGDTADGPFDDGAAYDPRSDTWRPLSTSPMSARNAPAAVWTGDRIIFWGGHARGSDSRDGASYDPATDTWEPIADAPMASAGLPQAVWTGNEMLVLAGFNSTEAAAYDPATDTWRTIDPIPGQPLGPNASVAWTGQQLVVGASYGNLGTERRGGVFAFDLDSGHWRELPPTGQRVDHLTDLAWTGGRLIRVTQQAGAPVTSYDFETDEWTGIATWPSDVPPMETATWTGTHLLLWGGGDEAYLLDPITGALDPTPAGGGSKRTQPASAWADGVLILWGGFPDRDDGLMLRPIDPRPTDPGTTVPLTAPDAPEPSGDLVPVAGPAGPVGFIDPNAGPTEVDGRLLPVRRVVDADGNLVGYFACSFLTREVVEDEDFDPSQACPMVTSTG